MRTCKAGDIVLGYTNEDDGVHVGCEGCGADETLGFFVAVSDAHEWAQRHVEDTTLSEALGRLRWVVPGQDHCDQLIADVQTVLSHFGMKNAHEEEA